MKIVLSRKGFDSSAGGAPSPILPDGRLVSLPIPDRWSPLRYADLRAGELPLGRLVHGLTRGRVRGHSRAHLDPDLEREHRPRPEGFRACLGQSGSAARHLEHRGVGVGDLFLFFGWFREVESIAPAEAGRFRYRKDAPDLHVIFGWLQVAQVLEAKEPWPDFSRRHPHRFGERPDPNRLFVAAKRLGLGAGRVAGLPGAGRFPVLREPQVLTAPGRSRSVWSLPDWCFPRTGANPLSYHEKASRWSRRKGRVELRSAARGQEFVLDTHHYPEAVQWCASILEAGVKAGP